MNWFKDTTTTRRGIGDNAEQTALVYLQDQGLKLVTRNYQCRSGEIDLVMRDGNTLVFVEVRFRRDAGFGGGEASVDQFKQRKLIRAAQHYLQHNSLTDLVPCRFDVVAIDRNECHQDARHINWIQHAFSV